MIPLRIKRKTYYLPTSYGEIPMWKLPLLPERLEDPDTFFSFLVDCDRAIDGESLLPYLGWINEPVNLSDYEPSAGIPDIKTAAWGKKIQCVLEIRKNTPVMSMVRIVSMYLNPDGTLHELVKPEDVRTVTEMWAKRSLDEVCPVYLNIVNQLNGILALEKALIIPPNREQVMAGIENFQKLGDMNTIDLIAGGDVLKYEAVLAIDYNTIYAKLLKLNISDKFTTAYKEILNRPK